MTTPTTTKIGDRQLLGASVLPYAIDTQHNNLYILLGAEARQVRWSESGKFSDFGGRASPRETAEACAAREFYEETCAMLTIGDTVHNVSDIETLLKNNKFTFKITTIIDATRYYVTFVKQIPFSASICRKYADKVQLLQRIRTETKMAGVYIPLNDAEKKDLQTHPAVTFDAQNERVVSVKKEYIEKDGLQWISLPHIREAIVRADMATPAQKMNNCIILRDTFRWRVKHVLPFLEEAIARWGGEPKLSMMPVNSAKPTNVRTKNYPRKFHRRVGGHYPFGCKGRSKYHSTTRYNTQHRFATAPSRSKFETFRIQEPEPNHVPDQCGAQAAEMQKRLCGPADSGSVQKQGKGSQTLGQNKGRFGRFCAADALVVPDHANAGNSRNSSTSATGNRGESGNVRILVRA